MSLHRKLHETFIIDHPAEAGQLLESFAISEIVRLIESVPPKSIAVLLSSMNPAVAGETLRALPDELGILVVRETSPGDAAGLLARLERDRRKAILRRLARPLAKEIRLFMEYPAESVGSLMDARVFALPEDLTVEEAVTQVRVRAPKDLHDIYVIDRRRYLVGMFSVRDLLLLNPSDRLQSVMRRDVPTIHPMENREEIVALFAGRRLVTIPVV
ncbi:MAG: CBS domain-containing protein, partial [Nitrospira sp.]|nr:CBS domain-containing protein [Nitrospira sp.]